MEFRGTIGFFWVQSGCDVKNTFETYQHVKYQQPSFAVRLTHNLTSERPILKKAWLDNDPECVFT